MPNVPMLSSPCVPFLVVPGCCCYDIFCVVVGCQIGECAAVAGQLCGDPSGRLLGNGWVIVEPQRNSCSYLALFSGSLTTLVLI